MKPTGQIETDLMFCFRYGLGDYSDFSQTVFDFKLSIRSPFFVISGQQVTKRTFHGRVTKLFHVVSGESIIEI